MAVDEGVDNPKLVEVVGNGLECSVGKPVVGSSGTFFTSRFCRLMALSRCSRRGREASAPSALSASATLESRF